MLLLLWNVPNFIMNARHVPHDHDEQRRTWLSVCVSLSSVSSAQTVGLCLFDSVLVQFLCECVLRSAYVVVQKAQVFILFGYLSPQYQIKLTTSSIVPKSHSSGSRSANKQSSEAEAQDISRTELREACFLTGVIGLPLWACRQANHKTRNVTRANHETRHRTRHYTARDTAQDIKAPSSYAHAHTNVRHAPVTNSKLVSDPSRSRVRAPEQRSWCRCRRPRRSPTARRALPTAVDSRTN